MRTILWLLIKIAVVIVLAIWFADNPGYVSVDWAGWRFETTAFVLIAALLVVIGVLTLLWRLMHGLLRLPRGVRRYRVERRRLQGYEALTQGLVAVAAGDAKEAQRFADRAGTLLPDLPLTTLLGAQAAQLSGDEGLAARRYEAMLDAPAAAFLGYRGLLTLALKHGDHERALELAEQARLLRPNTPWLLETLVDLKGRTGDWTAAAAELTALARRHGAPLDTAQRRAVTELALARQAAGQGDSRAAGKHIDKALGLAHEFVPAVAAEARALLSRGRMRRAATLIERLWPRVQHPELAELHGATIGTDHPLNRVKKAETLFALAPESGESALVLGKAQLAAQLFAEARRNLDAAARDPLTAQRALRALAELERAEKHDSDAAARWSDMAATAPASPAWLCSACGHAQESWDPACPSCGAVGTQEWKQPATPRHDLPVPVANDTVTVTADSAA